MEPRKDSEMMMINTSLSKYSTTWDPEKRMSMKFPILFEDDDRVWLNYDADLAAAPPFAEYCDL